MTEIKRFALFFLALFSIFTTSCKQNSVPSAEAINLSDGCELGPYRSDFLGEYKICRPNKNETLLRVEIKNPIIERKYCFVPNYLNSTTKKAIYLGEPRCIFVKFPNRSYDVSLLKNRISPQTEDDYSKFPINSVMILIDQVHTFPPPYEYPMSSVEAYLKCYEFMDSLEDSGYCQAFKKMKVYTFHSFST